MASRGHITLAAILAVLVLVGAEQILVVVVPVVSFEFGEVVFWILAPLAVAVIASVVAQRVAWPLWGERRWRWGDVGFGVAGGLAVLGIDEIWWRLEAVLLPVGGDPLQGFISDGFATMPIVVFVGVALVSPVAEEVVFRGVLHRGLAVSMPRWLALVLSSAAFGLMHLEGTYAAAWSLALSAAVAGAVFAVLYDHRKHLLAPVVAHVVVNTVASLQGLFLGTILVLSVGPGGDVPAVELPPGACARTDVFEGGAITQAEQVSCDLPHDVEVAYRGPVQGSSSEASYDVVADAADSTCIDVFADYVGIAWEDSDLDVLALLPTDARWAAGERELVCLLVPWLDDELTRPAQGSRR